MNPLTFKASALESEHDPRTYVHDMASLTTYTKGGYDYSSEEIENQHKVGICTASSIVENAEKATGKKYSQDFQYLLQKKFIDKNWDEGSAIFNGLKAAKTYGFLPLELFPYIIESDRLLPYEQYIEKLQAIPDAEVQRLITLCEKKLVGYASVDISTKENIAHAVDSSKSGIVCRYTITDRWWLPSWNEKDINPLEGDGNVVGGHAINLTNYDYTKGAMQTLTNTWGTLWCRGGKIDVDYSKYQMTEAWIPYYEVMSITPKFTQYLQVGSTGTEVKNLQKFLGVIQTGYFGVLTKNAVINFQKKNNIQQTGTVGPITRAALNKQQAQTLTQTSPMNTHSIRTVGLLAIVFAVAGLQAIHGSVANSNLIDMVVAVLLTAEHMLGGNTSNS